MKLRQRARKLLKTVPGKAAAALLSAVIVAVVGYFAPGILDSLTGKDELQISVQTDPDKIDTFDDLGQMVIVPDADDATGNPGKVCGGFHRWALGVGGVQAGRTDFRLVVQGASEEVHIGGIRARILDRREPLAGTGFRCPGGGAAEVRQILIDLDQPGRQAEGVWLVGETEKNVSFTVAPGETEIFDVSVYTGRCYCRWVLELVTTRGGEEEILTVDADGRPFETTAWAGEPGWGEKASQSPPYYSWDWQRAWTIYHPQGGSDEYPVEEGPPPPLPTNP